VQNCLFRCREPTGSPRWSHNINGGQCWGGGVRPLMNLGRGRAPTSRYIRRRVLIIELISTWLDLDHRSSRSLQCGGARERCSTCLQRFHRPHNYLDVSYSLTSTSSSSASKYGTIQGPHPHTPYPCLCHPCFGVAELGRLGRLVRSLHLLRKCT
jgi:hypothetical protein